MNRAGGAARRSGDPRVRAAAVAAGAGSATRHRLGVAVAGAVGAVVVGLAVVGAAGDEAAPAARGHAEVACDLTRKADQATEVSTRSRMAAAVLLLDRAILASERAASTDPVFTDLDVAVQEVHTAGHRGDPQGWAAAMADALAACDAAPA